ncbi:MAG: peptidoglycan DD-metalloendopeptidase family protein, partial [Ilumatobacteraceae bacterium]|nr:peptidoglycan DD-metalloendopeptidase family protein [Ilumatobacteraceae bacterium]
MLHRRCSVVVLLLVASCWLPPVDAPVVDAFRPPPCRWCPGNRGLEYGTDPGTLVRAVASGTVTFAGRVAGAGYVTVAVDGPGGESLLVTYGGVTTSLRAGSVVLAGSVVGRTDGRLHLGVRRGGAYVDPAPLVGRPRGPIRLVPTDASPARPVAPADSICWPDRPIRTTHTTRTSTLRSPRSARGASGVRTEPQRG